MAQGIIKAVFENEETSSSVNSSMDLEVSNVNGFNVIELIATLVKQLSEDNNISSMNVMGDVLKRVVELETADKIDETNQRIGDLQDAAGTK